MYQDQIIITAGHIISIKLKKEMSQIWHSDDLVEPFSEQRVARRKKKKITKKPS